MANICMLQTGTGTETTESVNNISAYNFAHQTSWFWPSLSTGTKKHGNSKLVEIQTQLIESDMLIHLPSRRATRCQGFPSCRQSQAVDTVACVAPGQTPQTHTLRRIPLSAACT